jgi:hypothetical protein
MVGVQLLKECQRQSVPYGSHARLKGTDSRIRKYKMGQVMTFRNAKK